MLDRSYLLLLLRRLVGMGRLPGQLVGWRVDVGSLLRDGISVRLDRRTYVLGALDSIISERSLFYKRDTAYWDLVRP